MPAFHGPGNFIPTVDEFDPVMSWDGRADVQQWRCLGRSQANQVWHLAPFADARYQLIAKHSSKCVTTTGMGNGVVLQQYPCGGWVANQLWDLVWEPSLGRYQIRSVASGKCLDVQGVSTADGAVVQQYDCLGTSQPNHYWSVTPYY